MPNQTPNIGLKKPLDTETVSRAAYNENLDIIDSKVAEKQSRAESYEITVLIAMGGMF